MFLSKPLKLEIFFDQPEDDPRVFPSQALKVLREHGLFSICKFDKNLFTILFDIGKLDLSVGRIYEGHVNALLLIDIYGTDEQKILYFEEAANGKLFGVWNTEDPKNGLQIKEGSAEGYRFLRGTKMFCSGGLQVDYPIVTANTGKGMQMLVLDIKKMQDLKEDWSLWDPVGMRPSVSCQIDFAYQLVHKDWVLGKLDDYYKEPFFSWGAVRFCAVQLGGAQKIADVMLQHLQITKRSTDPYQRSRIGKVAILMQTGKLWLKEAAKKNKQSMGEKQKDLKINYSNMMRTMTLMLCEDVIKIADKAVGIQGVMKDHPLERPVRDLRVYLKQAGPDNALAQVGTFIDKFKNNAERE